MDYLALDRPRIFMPLSPSAVAAKYADTPKMEGAWHPCLVMEGRPSLGAQKLVLRAQEKADEVTLSVRPSIVEMVDRELASLGEDEVKLDIEAEVTRANDKVKVPDKLAAKHRPKYVKTHAEPEYTNRRQYRDWLIRLGEISHAGIDAAAHDVIAMRVAVMTHSVTGDWSLYASSWVDDVAWPDLDEPGALEARLAIVGKLAREDVFRAHKAVRPRAEVSEDEAKKSEGPQITLLEGPTTPIKSSDSAAR